MHSRTILLSTVLMLGLSACDTKPTNSGPVAGNDVAPTETAAPRTPVKLPPSIVASKQYRCADNSLAMVEFYSDGLSASVRTDPHDQPVRVLAPTLGEPLVADGWSLKGGKDDAKIMFGSPKHPKPQSCHV